MYRILTRLKTSGYLGTVETPTVSILMTAKMLATVASNSSGLALLGDGDSDNAALILKPDINTGTQLFQGANCGYMSSTGTTVIIPPGTTPTVTFPSTSQIGPDQGFFVSLLVYNATNNAARNASMSMAFGNWRILYSNGKMYCGYRNEQWTAELEEAALESDDDDTRKSLQGPRAYQDDGSFLNPDAIYDAFQSIPLNNDSQSSVAGAFIYLWIIPQPGFGLYIATGQDPFNASNSKSSQNIQSVELPDYLKSGLLYPQCNIYVTSTRTNFTIGGFPLKFATGTLVCGPFPNGVTSGITGGFTTNKQTVEPPGTSVTIHEATPGFSSFLIPVTLETDTFATPFVYWIAAGTPGDTFAHITANQYDSNTNLDHFGNPPITTIDISCDGDMRRSQYEITLRRADQVGAQLTSPSALLENQIATFSFTIPGKGELDVLTGGIIQPCSAARVKKMTADGLAQWSEVTLTLNDKWKIAEDQIIGTLIPGDGLFLGDYITYVLTSAGFTSDEIIIPASSGLKLPTADYGQPPCIVPREGTSCADFLRELMDNWGFENYLIVDNNGKWNIVAPASGVVMLNDAEGNPTIPAEFSSDPARMNEQTYPGRLAILGATGPDWVRDSSEFYNGITVKGAVYKGQRLTSSYIDQASIYDPTAPNFIGRFKPMATVTNDGLRTQDVVTMVCRSLALRYAISSRMYQFESFFTYGMNVNNKIKVDGKLCRIKRLDSASLTNDRMSLVVQEIH